MKRVIIAFALLASASPALADSSITTLTTSWQQIAASGASIDVEALGGSIVVSTGSTTPAANAGQIVQGLDHRQYTLTQNLYGRVNAQGPNGQPVYAIVTPSVGSAAGGGGGGGSSAITSPTGPSTPASSAVSTTPIAASYQLLSNASSSGSAVTPVGSNYLLALSGTFNGATVTVNSTVNGVTTVLGSYTSSPSNVVCYAVAGGTSIQAIVSGGTPSGLNATLGGVGSGGCAGSVTTVQQIAPAFTAIDRGGTITTAGTAQTFMPANASRHGYEIQNQSSASLYVNCEATATADYHSRLIPANGSLYESSILRVPTGACSIIGATAGQAFYAREF